MIFHIIGCQGNTDPSDKEIPLAPTRMATLCTPTTLSAGEKVKHGNSYSLLLGMLEGTATLEDICLEICQS